MSPSVSVVSWWPPPLDGSRPGMRWRMVIFSGPMRTSWARARLPGPVLRPDLPRDGAAAVRPEFRADEIVFDPADPVFGGAICKVAGCPRTARGGRGLCSAHHDRWTAEGRGDLDAFVASTSPRWQKQEPLAAPGPGCRRGVRRQRLCTRHSAAWERAGRPDADEWLVSVPVTVPPAGEQDCLIGFCGLWAELGIPFCQGHGATWKVNGRPEPGGFAARYGDDDQSPAMSASSRAACPRS